MPEITREAVVDYLSNLPVIQIAELIKTLEDKWGVKAAPVAVAAAAGPAAAAAPVEAQTEFTVELKEIVQGLFVAIASAPSAKPPEG